MGQYTPGPLHVRTLDQSIGSVDDEAHNTIFQAQQISADDARAGAPIRKANAERLALVWNCHDELLGAVQKLRSALIGVHGDARAIDRCIRDSQPHLALDAADAALSKALGDVKE